MFNPEDFEEELSQARKDSIKRLGPDTTRRGRTFSRLIFHTPSPHDCVRVQWTSAWGARSST